MCGSCCLSCARSSSSTRRACCWCAEPCALGMGKLSMSDRRQEDRKSKWLRPVHQAWHLSTLSNAALQFVLHSAFSGAVSRRELCHRGTWLRGPSLEQGGREHHTPTPNASISCHAQLREEYLPYGKLRSEQKQPQPIGRSTTVPAARAQLEENDPSRAWGASKVGCFLHC